MRTKLKTSIFHSLCPAYGRGSKGESYVVPVWVVFLRPARLLGREGFRERLAFLLFDVIFHHNPVAALKFTLLSYGLYSRIVYGA